MAAISAPNLSWHSSLTYSLQRPDSVTQKLEMEAPTMVCREVSCSNNAKQITANSSGSEGSVIISTSMELRLRKHMVWFLGPHCILSL